MFNTGDVPPFTAAGVDPKLRRRYRTACGIRPRSRTTPAKVL
jgi:hypothetical protein